MPIVSEFPLHWPLENRPQDPDFCGAELTFEPCDSRRPFPQAIAVTDKANRSCKYSAVPTHVVDSAEQEMALRFTTLEHAGDYPDMMPQEIEAMDRSGNLCTYLPLNPRLFC